MNVRRGDTYYADFSPVIGPEQGGVKPVLIVQNDAGNWFSPTVTAVATTSQRAKVRLPTYIILDVETTGLARDPIVLLEQIRTIDKHRLKERMGRSDGVSMSLIDQALPINFGLEPEAEVRQAIQKGLNHQQYEEYFYLTRKE